MLYIRCVGQATSQIGQDHQQIQSFFITYEEYLVNTASGVLGGVLVTSITKALFVTLRVRLYASPTDNVWLKSCRSGNC